MSHGQWRNLLDNVAKYMGDQPDPLIVIERQGKDAERGQPICFVKDSGFGIEPEFPKRFCSSTNWIRKVEAQGLT